MSDLLLVLSTTSDLKVPELMGSLFAAACLAMGIAKTVAVMRRETASTACLAALAVLLASFLISGLGGTLRHHVPGPFGNVVAVLSTAVSMFGILCAMVLAIVGLATYSQPRAVPFTQGRGQAIWTLGLSIIPIGAVLVGVFIGGRSLAKSGGGNPKPDPVVNEELNFRFEPPGRPWIKMNAKVHNPAAELMYRRNRPDRLFILIAEDAGANPGLTTDALADIAKSNIESQEGTFEFEPAPATTVNGIRYSIFRTKSTDFNGLKGVRRWEHWVSMHGGFAYQLVFHGVGDEKESLSKEAQAFVADFSPADPSRKAPGLPAGISAYRSKEHGVSIDLTGKGWFEFSGKEEDYPEACFAAVSGSKSTGVAHLHLEGLDPGIDELASGFLGAGFGITHPENTSNRRECTQGVATGIELGFEREVDGRKFSYLHRILRVDGHAWMLSAWADREDSGLLPGILDGYEISRPESGIGVPDAAAIETASARILNQVGLAYYRQERHGAALAYFEHARKRDPGSEMYFENMVDSHFRTGQHAKVIELVRSEPEIGKERPWLRVMEASSLRFQERFEEAAEAYAAAFDTGYEDEDDLLDFINTLVDLEDRERGVGVLESYRERHPDASVSIERWRASLLSQMEKHDEAIDLLNGELQKSPGNVRLSCDLIEAKLDAGRHAEALGEVEELLAKGSRNAEILLLKGRAKLGLDSIREARAVFEEARELAPDSDRIAGYLEHVATLLGKGDISMIRESIDPLPVPSEVSELDQSTGGKHLAELSETYGAVHQQRILGVSKEKGKPLKRTSRTTVRITGSSGLEDYSTLRFSFDPSIEAFCVNEVVVKDRAGNTVGTGKLEDYYLVDKNDDDLATTEKLVHVPVPGIAIGNTLSYTVTWQQKGVDDEIDYDRVYFSGSYPTPARILYFMGSTENLSHRSSPDVRTMPLPGGIAFYAENPPVAQNETMQPWVETFQPWVGYSDASLTWSGEAAEYLERLEPVLSEEDDATKEQAVEIALAESASSDKIKAISGFVARTLTYQAIEFGPRGRIPDSASKVLKNRYGDCKDHSLLLVKMLRWSGIDAHLALVSTENPIETDLVSLDQFNHMIAYVPDAEGSPFIDTTQDHFPFGEIPPLHLLNEKALILDPDNVRFELVSPNERSSHGIRSERQIRPDPGNKGAARVEETLQLEGYMAAWFRSDFEFWREPDYPREISSLLRDYGNPEIESLALEGLSENHGPLVLKLVYSVPGTVRIQNGKTVLHPPAVWERYFLERRDAPGRRNPFEVSVPTNFSSMATIHFPGAVVDPGSVEEFSESSDDDFYGWEIRATRQSAETIAVESRARSKTGSFPKERFRQFLDSANHGIRTLGKTLLFDERPEIP